jgi:diaminohydroxyphosphoribosylaminopyrimidine deaminase / 5-amino-6-(5-phosphoribosylamino)uracil reductase
MHRALELARRGWGRVSPNPMVGAVIVRDGEVVGEGWHAQFGGDHAEIAALRQAGSRARGSTAYVTLEPCAHFGKTPPCADALLAAGIERVVYAAADPNPGAAGGADRLASRGMTVVGGVAEHEARELNAAFFHRYSAEGAGRPWVELKLAMSLDARMADREGRSAWITGSDARAEVHRMRAAHDAIAVGIGTVLADDPLLTVRGDVRPQVPPTRVVFDRSLRLPASCQLLESLEEAPVRVVHGPEADPARAAELRDRGVGLIAASTLQQAMAGLLAEDIRSMFCEGGALIASSLLRENLVDRMTLFYAPVLLGPEGLSPFALIPSDRIDEVLRWRTLGHTSFGPDTLISFSR